MVAEVNPAILPTDIGFVLNSYHGDNTATVVAASSAIVSSF